MSQSMGLFIYMKDNLMKKIKYLLLAQLIMVCSLAANAQQIKDKDCDCRFKAGDVVTVTRFDLKPSLVGYTGTILLDCNPARYHLTNFPNQGGAYEILDDDMGAAR